MGLEKTEIDLLLDISSYLELQKSQKLTQIDILKKEIDEIQNKLLSVRGVVSGGSFTSAANIPESGLPTIRAKSEPILSVTHDDQNLIQDPVDIVREYDANPQPIDNVDLSRKIFDHNQKQIANLGYKKDAILIRFNDPLKAQVTQPKYITEILTPILPKLKELEDNMKVTFTNVEKNGWTFISTITLNNITNIATFEILAKQIERYFTH